MKEELKRSFGKRCQKAFAVDPIGDFAQQLIDEGMTEAELQQALAGQPTLPCPFKVALQNKYRDKTRPA